MSVAERGALITHLKDAAQAVDGYLSDLRAVVAEQKAVAAVEAEAAATAAAVAAQAAATAAEVTVEPADEAADDVPQEDGSCEAQAAHAQPFDLRAAVVAQAAAAAAAAEAQAAAEAAAAATAKDVDAAATEEAGAAVGETPKGVRLEGHSPVAQEYAAAAEGDVEVAEEETVTDEEALMGLLAGLLERWRVEVCGVTSDNGECELDEGLRGAERELAAECREEPRISAQQVALRARELQQYAVDLRARRRLEEEALLSELQGGYQTQKHRLGEHLVYIHDTCKAKEEEDRLCRDAELIAQRRDEDDYRAILEERLRQADTEQQLLLTAGPQTPEEAAEQAREEAAARAEDARRAEKRRMIEEAERRRALRKGYSTVH